MDSWNIVIGRCLPITLCHKRNGAETGAEALRPADGTKPGGKPEAPTIRLRVFNENVPLEGRETVEISAPFTRKDAPMNLATPCRIKAFVVAKNVESTPNGSFSIANIMHTYTPTSYPFNLNFSIYLLLTEIMKPNLSVHLEFKYGDEPIGNNEVFSSSQPISFTGTRNDMLEIVRDISGIPLGRPGLFQVDVSIDDNILELWTIDILDI